MIKKVYNLRDFKKEVSDLVAEDCKVLELSIDIWNGNYGKIFISLEVELENLKGDSFYVELQESRKSMNEAVDRKLKIEQSKTYKNIEELLVI